jgi:hypothetical protein
MNFSVVPPRPGLPRAVDRSELVEAVRTHTSWRGVMRRLGFTTSRTGRVLREICDELGVDYGHFRSIGPDDASIAAVVPASDTWAEALQQLGYASGSGSARATLRKHCQRLGVDTSHLRLHAVSPDVPHVHSPQLEHLRAAGPHLVSAVLTLLGYRVSGAAEGAAYDLVLDDPKKGLLRVQVKTTTRRSANTWNCKLTRSEYRPGVIGGHARANYCAEDVDVFACVDGDGRVYLIPIALVEGMTCISVRRYDDFCLPLRLDGLPPKQ